MNCKLLIKYELLKREDSKHLKKLAKKEKENKLLKDCLDNEEKRTKKFRSAYKMILNEYEDLNTEYQEAQKEIKRLDRQVKRLEKNYE
jgi:predicted  nucleic acid-binding Zn-ribbon protein